MLRRMLNRQQLRQGVAIGALVVVVVLTLRGVGVFTQLRLQFSNVYYVEMPVSGQIVMVALDDASLQRFGRTPAEWSRGVFVDLLAQLAPAEPRVIAFDLLLTEPTPDDEALAQAIQNLRQMPNRPRIVFPVVGIPPASLADDPDFPHAIRFFTQLRPIASLVEAADYLGYVNTFPDADSVIRRQPSIVQVNDTVGTSFSIAVYLAYLRVPASAWAQVVTSPGDHTVSVTPQRTLPVDDLGFWQQHYFGPPFNLQRQTFPLVSLVDILDGQADMSLFNNRLVLVGLINSTGLTDQYPVPSATQGQLMSGMEIQANAIETLIQNRALAPAPLVWEGIAFALLAVATSVIYSGLRWYSMFATSLAFLALGIGGSFLLFAQYNVVVSLFDLVLVLVLPVAITLGQDTINEINRRRAVEFVLESVSHASRQKLAIDRILPLIAQDVQRIVPRAHVDIWACLIASDRLEHVFKTHEQDVSSLAGLVEQVQRSRVPHINRALMVVPFVWQQRVNSVMIVTLPPPGALGGRATRLIESIARELAPVIDNALLFTETERQRVILEAVVDESPNYVLVLDDRYQIRRMSRIVATTFELQPDDYHDQPVTALLGAIGIRYDDEKLISEALVKRHRLHRQVTIRDRSLILNVVPLDPLRWWVVTLTDVSNLVRLNQLKTNMVRMLSHDLGNPLSRILGYSSLLRSEPENLSESQRMFLAQILEDGEEMNRIIEDVMQLENLRSSEIRAEAVDFSAVVEAVVRRYRQEAAANQQALIVETHDTDRLTVQGNHRQLVQMVSNLIGNAIKYTPTGGRIVIRLEKRDKCVLLEVADTGYGIPPEAQPHLFNEFYRVRTPAMGHIKGHGLGLSLVKAIVDAHKGRIWLESEEGVGSRFYVELPAD